MSAGKRMTPSAAAPTSACVMPNSWARLRARVSVGSAGEQFEHGVVATRRPAEHERGAEVVQQARAERVVGLDADPARDRGRGGRGRDRVRPEVVGHRATLLGEEVERGGRRDGPHGGEAEHRHGAPRARHLARQAVEGGVREPDHLRRERRVGLDQAPEVGRGRARVLQHPEESHRGARLHRQLGDLGDQVVCFGCRHCCPR